MVNFSRFFSIVTLYIAISAASHAQTIEVGFEPFPPLINEDGSGLVVNMLNALAAKENLQFNFNIMTYGRAKKDLQNQQIDLIGLTPYQLETSEFYRYATELKWHINTHVDFFSLDKAFFDIENLPDGSIGTPTGNAEFFSAIIGVPEIKFVEVSSLEQLVKMLALGRLKVILFERVSTISTINSLSVENIYYQKMGIVPASLAVPNTQAGLTLKKQLNKLLLNVQNDDFFSEFINYTSMSDSGVVILESPYILE